MLVIDKMIASGLGFVLQRIADAVDAESDPTATLHAALQDAQARLDRGEITEAEYDVLETELLTDLHRRRRAEAPTALSHVTVDVIEMPPEIDEKGATPHAPPKRKGRGKRRR